MPITAAIPFDGTVSFVCRFNSSSGAWLDGQRDAHGVAMRPPSEGGHNVAMVVLRAPRPYGNAKTTTADVPPPPKKPDTTPEVVATYCLPSIAYVITPPPTEPPVLKV
jgi:hypothetical protein